MASVSSIRLPLVIRRAIVFTLLAAPLLFGCSRRSGDPATGDPDCSDGEPFFAYLTCTPLRPAMVAFSPTSHDPRTGPGHTVPSRESLQADLAALGPFDGLILYGYDADYTPVLIEEAHRQGVRAVLLGIWDVRSSAELNGVATLTATYKDSLALAICIGNEGLMFNRYTRDDLAAAVDTLRNILGPTMDVPLTTSEPLVQYNQTWIQSFGDFCAPNIHPIFDRPNLNAQDAAAWTRERAIALAESAQKPVLVKETGFPHGGQTRFSEETQEEFWTAYVGAGVLMEPVTDEDVWISFCAAFEAFDLPWKAEESGVVFEGMWGLLSEDRETYPAFSVWENEGRGRRSR